MLQLIERRDGAPRIRRPRLQKVPPRRVARPLLVAVGLLALTIAGMWAGLRVAGRTTHNTALGTISFSVSPSIHGRVDAFVPIADWGARAHAFQAPITVHVEPRAVNRRTVVNAAGGNGTALAQAERDSRGAARSALLRAYRYAVGAGYTSQVQRALGGFAALVAAGGRFSTAAPPTTQVVLASDLHDNIPALDAVRSQFRREPIFFPGDFGQNGGSSESKVLVRKF